MIVSTYYNKENDVLIMSTVKKANKTKQVDNMTLLLNNDEVVGINVFNPKENYQAGLLNSKDIDPKITSYFNAEIENPFIVGQIKSIESHPKSDKLNVCQVQLNDQDHTQIVCSAANVEANIKIIVAKVGAVMPNGMAIVPSKLIDVQSNGMICSLRELGRVANAPGIEILSDEYNCGEDYI